MLARGCGQLHDLPDRYYTTLQPLAVLDVLMADETNPRSLDFQLSHLAISIKSFLGMPGDLAGDAGRAGIVAQFRSAQVKVPIAGRRGGKWFRWARSA
jgi:uncharacterized alpha-E superfamily protein